MTTDSRKWFVRRAGKIRGPFSYTILTKLARLGRLKRTDELSNNREKWKSASDYPELFKDAEADLLLKDDERSGWDRRENVPSSEKADQEYRQGKERRKPESEEEISRRRGRTELLEAIHDSRKEDHFPIISIAFSIVMIIILGLLMMSSEEVSEPDCEAPAQPEVNWDNCKFDKLTLKQKDLSQSRIRNAVLIGVNLQGATLVESNLSYTDLSEGNLKNANLDKAILKGANLKLANLKSASLKGADLSYTDLRGAQMDKADLSQSILDKAIWLDGSLCAKGSIGRCLPE